MNFLSQQTCENRPWRAEIKESIPKRLQRRSTTGNGVTAKQTQNTYVSK